MYLLDTEVVWAMCHVRSGRADPAFAAWAQAQVRTSLFLSAIALAELGAAAAQVERTDRVAAAKIRHWLGESVTATFDGRTIPVDAAVALRASRLGYRDQRNALVAACALEHGLTLATRAAGAFRTGKVKTIDPWGYAPVPDEGGDWRQAARGGPIWLKNLFARG